MAADTQGNNSALPYHEPGVNVILILSSFLILLNVFNYVLNRYLYCGLLGQVLLGVAFGTSGAKWLSADLQSVIVQTGYLGLILLVYEGGLSTSIPLLRTNLLLCMAVAATGIILPMALSFVLQPMLGASPLQAFAAGAALCSTSLGTTFTVLTTSNLTRSRLGVVLSGAAMMDDVVGLVLVQVIANLGSGDIEAMTVVRPIIASLGMAIVAPLLCVFVVAPLMRRLHLSAEQHPEGRLRLLMQKRQTAFVVHTSVLIGFVAAAMYAGSSGLFAAYLAGACISWWDSRIPASSSANSGSTQAEATEVPPEATSGVAIYARYYGQAVERILCPFFFASIGFAIPITNMFSGQVVWQGLVYSVLMSLAKVACGLWLVRFNFPAFSLSPVQWFAKLRVRSTPPVPPSSAPDATAQVPVDPAVAAEPPVTQSSSSTPRNDEKSPAARSRERSPRSMYPTAIVGCAMVARGEIGFLVSALAASTGVFDRASTSTPSSSSTTPSDLFLVVTWAIVLCTIIGPLAVGILVRRVRTLERRRRDAGATEDVLGTWGVDIQLDTKQEDDPIVSPM